MLCRIMGFRSFGTYNIYWGSGDYLQDSGIVLMSITHRIYNIHSVLPSLVKKCSRSISRSIRICCKTLLLTASVIWKRIFVPLIESKICCLNPANSERLPPATIDETLCFFTRIHQLAIAAVSFFKHLF